jgi:hypothetical protein
MSEAKKFRKKPVVIEAIQFTGHNGNELRDWSGGVVVPSPVLEPGPDNLSGRYVQIATLEGTMIGNEGDWIICGVKGEFYPCKPDIFALNHEDASSHTPPRPKLEKVRSVLEMVLDKGSAYHSTCAAEALAELDAAEGR